MSLRINDEAPNFTAETTQGTINFHDRVDWLTAGRSYFPTRKTSRWCAPLNWGTWLSLSLSSRNATPRSSA